MGRRIARVEFAIGDHRAPFPERGGESSVWGRGQRHLRRTKRRRGWIQLSLQRISPKARRDGSGLLLGLGGTLREELPFRLDPVLMFVAVQSMGMALLGDEV